VITTDDLNVAIETLDFDKLVLKAIIVECPVCGEWEADCNKEVAEAFGIGCGCHCGAVDRVCASTGVHYMPADSVYAAPCFSHVGEG